MKQDQENSKAIVIGLCGESGAGKSTTAELISKQGFISFSPSSLVREEAIKISGPSREQIQEYAQKKQAEAGADYFARRFIESVHPFQHQRVVLDGVRNLQELALYRHEAEKAGSMFILFAIVTQGSHRFFRVRGRGRTGDPDTLEGFKAADARAAGNADAFQQNLMLIDHADYKLVNDGTQEELEEAISSIIQDIMKRNTESA